MASKRRDIASTLLGVAVFIGGIAILGITFLWAQQMFTVPPAEAMGLKAGEPLDVNVALGSFLTLLIRVLLLGVMAALGAVMASRGVKLYLAARVQEDPAE